MFFVRFESLYYGFYVDRSKGFYFFVFFEHIFLVYNLALIYFTLNSTYLDTLSLLSPYSTIPFNVVEGNRSFSNAYHTIIKFVVTLL